MQPVGIVNLYSFKNSRRTRYQRDLTSEMSAIHLIFVLTFPYKMLHFGYSFFFFFCSDVISSTVLNSPLACKLAPLTDQYALDAGI